MIRYIALFFGYWVSLKLTSSTQWFRDFTKKFTTKNKQKEQNNQFINSNKVSDEEAKEQRNLRKILNLLDETPSENEIKLSYITKKKSYLKQFWPGVGCCLIILLATVSVTMKPFSSNDVYLWNYVVFIFFLIIWNNFKTCTQVPIYILVFFAREKLCRLFPFRLSSRLMGKISDLTIPVNLRKAIFSLYIKTYGVQIEEAENQNLLHYKSLNLFFRRSIQKVLRPISPKADLVSPCDGTIVFHSRINDGIVREVKGLCFSLKELFSTATSVDKGNLDEGDYAKRLMSRPTTNQLFACVIYLAPGDYHRFHSPADCYFHTRRHVSGELISVKPRLLSWLPHLFAINERVVLRGRYKNGFLSTVAVGATNVGSIIVYNDDNLKTNLWETKLNQSFDKKIKMKLQKGDPLGEFRFGSTVIVVYEAPKTHQIIRRSGDVIKYGQGLF